MLAALPADGQVEMKPYTQMQLLGVCGWQKMT